MVGARLVLVTGDWLRGAATGEAGMNDRVEYLDSRVLSQRWGTLTLHRIRYRMRDGHAVELDREVYDHGPAVAVLLISPTRQKVLLTRQFRISVDLTGHHADLLEACAGLNGDDGPEAAARREALEETGVVVGDLTEVFSCFMSPGSVTERVTGYIATYDAPPVTHGGLAEEHEDIEIVEIDYADVRPLVMSGALHDGKTLLLLQHALLTGLIP